MHDLPSSVEMPLEALITAVATFHAYGNLASIVSGRTDTPLADALKLPAYELLFASDLSPAQRDELGDLIERRANAIAANMLKRLAAQAAAEAMFETRNLRDRLAELDA